MPVDQVLHVGESGYPSPGDRQDDAGGDETSDSADGVDDHGQQDTGQDPEQDLRVRKHSVHGFDPFSGCRFDSGL